MAARGRARRVRGGSVASRPHVVARRMHRTCVCTNPNCDKVVERFAFALAKHWSDDELKSILSSLRPNDSRHVVEKYFSRAMTKPDGVRMCSRHFFWHTLAWSRGDRPTLHQRRRAQPADVRAPFESTDVCGRTNRRSGSCGMVCGPRNPSQATSRAMTVGFAWAVFQLLFEPAPVTAQCKL